MESGGFMPTWIVAVQWLSRSVLGVLFILSIWSVATMIRCVQAIKVASGPAENTDVEIQKITALIVGRQWDSLKAWAEKETSLYAGVIRTLLKSESELDRAFRSYLNFQKTRLEEGLTILATLGSNAPFIGLFGTVLGIIQAFGALGAHQNNTSDIMVGISEALIATAVGLFVAIPAVVAFNLFTRKLRVLISHSEALKDLFLSYQNGK